MNRRGFTLIETMLAVLVMAIVAAGVTLNLSRPLQEARAEDAAAMVTAFDAAARQAAIASGRPVRIALDLSAGTLARVEGDAAEPAARVALPSGYRIDRVKVGRRVESAGLVDIPVSARGWSPTYAVRLVGPRLDRWYAVAGLSGIVTEAKNEANLPAAPRTPGYDAD